MVKKSPMKNCACSVFRACWENTVPKKWKYTKLHPPQTTVVVHYNSHTPTCTWDNHCVEQMVGLYKRYLDQGLPDIPYNFVVGGDGEAYCGRGWKRQSDPCLPYPELLGKRIDILLFGDWSDTEPPQPMRDMLATLIDYGVKHHRIAKEYHFLTVDNHLWDDYVRKHSNIINNFT